MSDIKTPWNPSTRATKRVKNPLPAPEQCNCCGREAVEIKNNAEVYGRSYGDWPWIFVCVSCGAYVSMHPFTNIPLGTLADAKTREARKECKRPFMQIYEKGLMDRSAAYSALAKKLDIPVGECHFGWFNADMCKRAAEASQQILLEIEAN